MDQRCHPSGIGQGSDERLGVGAVSVNLSVIFIGELGADSANASADIFKVLSVVGHSDLPRSSDVTSIGGCGMTSSWLWRK